MESTNQISQILQDKYGFDDLKPGQEAVLKLLNEGKNTLAVLPTGAGKTLIYQMYGFTHPGSVVIISPLLSLIQDQINRLRLIGEKSILEISSRVNHHFLQQQLKNLNQYKFIFTSPESIQKPEVRKALQNVQLALMVIDEAHCIPQWGESFRPDYLRIGEVREQLNKPLTLMLTATASSKTRKSIVSHLNIKHYEEYVASVDRPNIFLDFLEFESRKEKVDELIQLVETLPGSGVIYFSSKKIANQVSEMLNIKTSKSVAAYHAGLDNDTRYKIQNQFLHDDIDVICATSAFGMGIDKNNIRFVIHFHMPGNIESYVQEIGRAGRDGLPSVAILLYQNGDEAIPSILNDVSIPNAGDLEFYAKTGNLDEQMAGLVHYYEEYGLNQQQIQHLFELQKQTSQIQVNTMLNLIKTTDCHRAKLMVYFDENKPLHNEKCCGSITDFSVLNLPEQSENNQELQLIDWQTKLAKMFF